MNRVLVPGFLTIWLAAPAAFGHAALLRETPQAGAQVAAAPSIALVFSEALEPHFSTLAVTDAAGVRVDRGALSVDGRTMRLALPPLKPGKYRVTWHAVSVDTHKSLGSYGFTVAP